MKKIILLSLAVLLSFGYWGCKKSESEGPTSPGTSENYFPNNEGTNYKYSYVRNDSTGQHTGTRSTYYKGTVTISGTTYKIQIDSLNLSAALLVDTSYFRTTSAGTYYFIDTTGFAASITDSALIPLIPFVTIDNELLAYSFPLQAGKSWTVFKINLTSPIFATVIDVSALAVGKESITLNLQSGQTNKEAMKIKFTLTLHLNPLSPFVQTYTAFVWLVQDIGPAKWEGSGTLVNVFTGLGIDFADTTTVVSQSLIDYSIK
jgi:hypothetical protein